MTTLWASLLSAMFMLVLEKSLFFIWGELVEMNWRKMWNQKVYRISELCFEWVMISSGQTDVFSGEAGLLVAPVTFTNPFLGYAGDKAMSENKLLRDVFKTGDVYFNTGDLMLQDHRDFVYFKDRIGDTFRSLFQCLHACKCGCITEERVTRDTGHYDMIIFW